MEERRAARQIKGKGMCFDDLVEKDGSLKRAVGTMGTNATTTAAEPQSDDTGLRHRGTEIEAATLGSNFANPFGDEMHIDHVSSPQHQTGDQGAYSRASTPTLPASPPVPPKPAAYQPQHLLVNTDAVFDHPSEQLVDLTPTTSASSASSAAADLAELSQGNSQRSHASYWSVDDWAQNHSVQSLHSPPQSAANAPASKQSEGHSLEGSLAGSVEHASQVGTEDMDVLSEFGEGISTPSTWTEVGSHVSEE